MAKITLKASKGTDEANFGTDLHRVGNSGTIQVEAKEVEALVSKGGFTIVPVEETPIPMGFVGVRSTGGAIECSFGGASYTAGEDGVFSVPADAVVSLLDHGFETI
jgi:hypothetical protein